MVARWIRIDICVNAAVDLCADQKRRRWWNPTHCKERDERGRRLLLNRSLLFCQGWDGAGCRFSAAKAGGDGGGLNAAVNRCATQKRSQVGV